MESHKGIDLRSAQSGNQGCYEPNPGEQKSTCCEGERIRRRHAIEQLRKSELFAAARRVEGAAARARRAESANRVASAVK